MVPLSTIWGWNDCAPLTIAIELLAKQVWYRAQTGIRRGPPPATSATPLSPAAKLPLEIVETIIAHLAYDTSSLLACSLTCYSWYITTVPHLHNSLVTPIYPQHSDNEILWPKQLRHMHKLGLLPLVKKFQAYERPCFTWAEISPKLFNCSILRQFIALTNVQELGIDYFNIPAVLPRVRRYFGHFLPTVQSLVLRSPKGSCRQIIYFIGLFHRLEDLKLLYGPENPKGEPADDSMLTPPSAPLLRGRLTLSRFTKVGLSKDMIVLFGGIRFRHTDLCDVDGMRLLLDACAKTLETLRLYLTDPHGGELSGRYGSPG